MRERGGVLRFSDGVEFDTGGGYRVVHASDGWYVVGKGMLCPVDDRADGEDLIARLTGKERGDGARRSA